VTKIASSKFASVVMYDTSSANVKRYRFGRLDIGFTTGRLGNVPG